MHKRFINIFATILVLLTLAPAAYAEVLLQAIKSGTLAVGVQSEYKPYGYIAPNGDIVGIEPTLAQDVADTLGVELELVPVTGSNRMEFLKQGKIDIIIATMTDTAERRRVIDILNPDYYSSGTNIMARKQSQFEKWDDLDGVPVCGLQGAFYNEKVSRQFGANITAFTGLNEALNALKQGRCAAFVHDNSFITSRLQEEQWSAYEMPLKTIDAKPWGVGVKNGETRMARFMQGMIVHWHVTGRIIDLQKEYGVDPVPFTRQMHELFYTNFVPSAE